jgi:amino acid transporter/mannitol/fructose-specific phosphotransferase system IIA component (Ntr-type)
LSLLGVFAVSVGAMISSGLFVLPGLAYAKAGPAVILAYLLAGIMVLPALFTKAELATAMPRAGGDYFFIERSMGPAAGTIGGLASWFSLSLKSALALVGIGAFATLINPSLSQTEAKLIAVGFCAFFTVINVLSVKFTGRFQTALVLLLIALVILYIIRGSVLVAPGRYRPFAPFGYHAVFAAAGLVFVSFGGLTKIVSVAEEVRNPTRNLPLGMILAFSVVLVLYAGGVFVTVGLLDGQELSTSVTPLSAGAAVTAGSLGRAALSVAAILAFVTTANAGILSASRFPMAMSRDRLAPRLLARVNSRFGTPHYSILLTCAFMMVAIVLLDLELLVKVASTMKVLLFMFVVIACVVLRESRILNYKPSFMSPLYPWIHIGGVIAYGFLLSAMGTLSLVLTGAFVMLSVAWYKLYTHGRVHRRSAMVQMVERVTPAQLAGGSLASELREILRERDSITDDRFDRLVRDCEVVDIKGHLSLDAFFTVVADRLSRRLELDRGTLLEALMQREEESTTVIRPGLAIPHVIIPGEGKFELLVARCEPGVDFVEEETPVYAVFVLAGSSDERAFHLRALAAIAQIVRDTTFDTNWLRARCLDDLRDIILLAQRRREGG